MLVIKDLSVTYESSHLVLDKVSLEIRPSAITGIIGPNGAGKSSLMKAMMGLVEHTGQLLVSGRSETSLQGLVAYVPQKSQIDYRFPITVRECVSLGRYRKNRLFSPLTATDWAVVDQALEQLMLTDLAHRPLHTLSGGQFQRLLVARSLTQEADYLFLDEPFVGIDVVSEQVIMSLLRQLKEQGKTILIVHHDLSKLTTYFDDLIMLNKRIIAHGQLSTLSLPELLEETYGETIVFGKD